MDNRPYSNAARVFCDAIRAFANNPDGLENLQSYLSYHFAGWLDHMANTPDNIAAELVYFSDYEELPF